MPEPYTVQPVTSQQFRAKIGEWCDQVAFAKGELIVRLERWRREGRTVYVISEQDFERLKALKSKAAE
jgi:hypothetical protein